ncbi:hypothetical protein QBC39DRAFT_356655 [Podospora conica]|nr:hypothetical protein QBC39DRAFT_356655 [Schizothecium conicum]
MSSSSESSQDGLPDVMSSSSENSQYDPLEVSVSRINIGTDSTFTLFGTNFVDCTGWGNQDRSIWASFLVIKGYGNLADYERLGKGMNQDGGLERMAKEYLAQAGEWPLRQSTRQHSPNTTSAHWVRPVAQKRSLEDRAERIRLAGGRLYGSENALHPGEPPAGEDYKIYTCEDAERIQPYRPLCRTENEDLSCLVAEERVFFYYNRSGKTYKPFNVDGVVFFDPVRRFRTEFMKMGEDGQPFLEKTRSTPYFIPAPKDQSAICDSTKMDLGEVDSEMRFFEALKPAWRVDRHGCFDVQKCVRRALASMMADDITHVAGRIDWALDNIERLLHVEDALRSSTPRWREELGVWRNVLANISKELEDSPLRDSEFLERENLLDIRDKLDRTSRRVESAFNALVGSHTLLRLEQELKDEKKADQKVVIGGTWQGTFNQT